VHHEWKVHHCLRYWSVLRGEESHCRPDAGGGGGSGARIVFPNAVLLNEPFYGSTTLLLRLGLGSIEH